MLKISSYKLQLVFSNLLSLKYFFMPNFPDTFVRTMTKKVRSNIILKKKCEIKILRGCAKYKIVVLTNNTYIFYSNWLFEVEYIKFIRRPYILFAVVLRICPRDILYLIYSASLDKQQNALFPHLYFQAWNTQSLTAGFFPIMHISWRH